MSTTSRYKPAWLIGLAAEEFAWHRRNDYKFLDGAESLAFIEAMQSNLPYQYPDDEPCYMLASVQVQILMEKAEEYLLEMNHIQTLR